MNATFSQDFRSNATFDSSAMAQAGSNSQNYTNDTAFIITSSAFKMNLVGYRHYLADKPALTVLFSTVLSISCVIGILGNTLVVFAVMLNKSLRQPGNLFIVNLAVADLFVNAFVDPPEIVGFVYGGRYFQEYPLLCELVASVCAPACLASMANICAIALNRYVSICHFHYYYSIFTWRNTVLMCVAIWLWSFAAHLPNHVGWGGFSNSESLSDLRGFSFPLSSETYSYAVAFISFGVLVPIALVIYSYVRIFITYRKARVRVAAHRAVQAPTPSASIATSPKSVLPNKNPATSFIKKDESEVNMSLAGQLNAPRDKKNYLAPQKQTDKTPNRSTMLEVSEIPLRSTDSSQRPKQASSTARKEIKREEDERKLVKTLFLIAVVFLVCWGPFALFVLLRQPDSIPTWIYIMSLLAAHANSTFNWIIYWATSSIFSAAFNAILRRAWFTITRRRFTTSAAVGASMNGGGLTRARDNGNQIASAAGAKKEASQYGR